MQLHGEERPGGQGVNICYKYPQDFLAWIAEGDCFMFLPCTGLCHTVPYRVA